MKKEKEFKMYFDGWEYHFMPENYFLFGKRIKDGLTVKYDIPKDWAITRIVQLITTGV